MKKKKLFPLIGSIIMLLCSCAPKDGGGGGGNDPVHVTSVTLNQETVDLDLNGTKTCSLVATVLPADATDKSITWTSSDTNKATVVNGLVTAKAVGDVTITAKSNDNSSIKDTALFHIVDTTPVPDKHSFNAGDYRVVTNGSKSADYIGAKATGDALSIKYLINMPAAENVELAFVISTRAQASKVKDIYDLKINGVEQSPIEADIPVDGIVWETYHEVKIGRYDLLKDQNEIEIVYDYSKSGHPAVNFKDLVIYSFAEPTFIEPEHTCNDICEYCGKCTNKNCQFTACADKCTCEATSYSISVVEDGAKAYGSIAIDESAGYAKNVDDLLYGYVKLQFIAAKAGRATLSMDISKNSQGTWNVVDYFRVYVNAGNKAVWDADEKTGILSKDDYSATTLSGSQSEFAVITVGLIDVIEGLNTIVVGWSSVGQAAYSFNFKGIKLETVQNTITASPIEEHVCADVCPICGLCTSDCSEPECADKCECGTTKSVSLKAANLPSYTYTGGDATAESGRNVDGDYYQLVGSSASINHLVFNVKSSVATKAAVFITMKSTNGLNISGVDGQNVLKFYQHNTASEVKLNKNIPASDDFVQVKLGVVDIPAFVGSNGPASFKMWLQGWSGTIQIRSIDLVVLDSAEIVFPYVPHTCGHVCPVCGKCLDASCNEPECADKCACPKTKTTEFGLADNSYSIHNEGVGAIKEDGGLKSVAGQLFHFKFYFGAKVASKAGVYLSMKGSSDGQSFNITNTGGYLQLGKTGTLNATPDASLYNQASNNVLSSSEYTDVFVGNIDLLPGEFGYIATWITPSASFNIKSVKIVADSNIDFIVAKSTSVDDAHKCVACGGCTSEQCTTCGYHCICESVKSSTLNLSDSCYAVHHSEYKITDNDANVIKVGTVGDINHIKSYFSSDKDTVVRVYISVRAEDQDRTIEYKNADGFNFQMGKCSALNADSSEIHITASADIVTSEYRSVCLGYAEIKAGDLFFVGFWLASTTREYLIKDITFVSSSGATLSAVLA